MTEATTFTWFGKVTDLLMFHWQNEDTAAAYQFIKHFTNLQIFNTSIDEKFNPLPYFVEHLVKVNYLKITMPDEPDRIASFADYLASEAKPVRLLVRPGNIYSQDFPVFMTKGIEYLELIEL